MPVKPENAGRYPKNWRDISMAIRERAGQRCECEGECGLHPDHRCEEHNGHFAKWAKGKIVLTVAHLNHIPEDCRADNLKAMCQRCHLRYDQKLHVENARKTRRARKAIGELI